MDGKKLFDEARRAVRDGNSPAAFVRLGSLYAEGIGTRENHVLANYFYQKALDMGSKEVEPYIEKEYENGGKDLAKDIEKAVESEAPVPTDIINRFMSVLERERKKKNYGRLAQVGHYLPRIYTYYNKDKGMADILADRDSIDADIYYANSSERIRTEMDVVQQDALLEQLYTPVTQDEDLMKQIRELNDSDLLQKSEAELLQCIVNLTYSYGEVCSCFGIQPASLMTVETMELYPYIRISTLTKLRRQALKALLTLKDVDLRIGHQYLEHLTDDGELLDICTQINDDKSLQLFLISFVEMNIDVELIMKISQALLDAYRKKDLKPLADHLNAFSKRLADLGIEHHLPQFSARNLPEYLKQNETV